MHGLRSSVRNSSGAQVLLTADPSADDCAAAHVLTSCQTDWLRISCERRFPPARFQLGTFRFKARRHTRVCLNRSDILRATSAYGYFIHRCRKCTRRVTALDGVLERRQLRFGVPGDGACGACVRRSRSRVGSNIRIVVFRGLFLRGDYSCGPRRGSSPQWGGSLLHPPVQVPAEEEQPGCWSFRVICFCVPA